VRNLVYPFCCLWTLALGAFGQAPARAPDGKIGVVYRKAQPYVGIRTKATIQEMPGVVPRLLPRIFGFLKSRGISPDGPVLLRYWVIDMQRSMEVEVGVPVATPVRGGDGVHGGVIPAGRYVSSLYMGRDLIRANGELQAWAKARGLKFQSRNVGPASRWVSRVEFYLTDPAKEPNMDRWRTEVVYLLRDKKAR
jgi:effector-binding domain-containing protein